MYYAGLVVVVEYLIDIWYIHRKCDTPASLRWLTVYVRCRTLRCMLTQHWWNTNYNILWAQILEVLTKTLLWQNNCKKHAKHRGMRKWFLNCVATLHLMQSMGNLLPFSSMAYSLCLKCMEGWECIISKKRWKRLKSWLTLPNRPEFLAFSAIRFHETNYF